MNKRCLKSHMVLHSDIVHKCNKCDYSTKKNVLLKRHLLTQVNINCFFTLLVFRGR